MYVEYSSEELEQMYQHYMKRIYEGASFIKRTNLTEITSAYLSKNGIGLQVQSDLAIDGILTVESIRNDVYTYFVNESALNRFMAEIQRDRGQYIDGQQTLGAVL